MKNNKTRMSLLMPTVIRDGIRKESTRTGMTMSNYVTYLFNQEQNRLDQKKQVASMFDMLSRPDLLQVVKSLQETKTPH